MIFRPELAAKVMAGEKTVTRRLCADNPRSPWWRQGCIYVEGKEFAVQPGRGKPSIGRARVTSCSRGRLNRLTDAEVRAEGFEDEPHFAAAFALINGSYDSFSEVWRIEFEVVAVSAKQPCVICGAEGHPYNMYKIAESVDGDCAEYYCQDCRWGL